jgi:hypothetical protein
VVGTTLASAVIFVEIAGASGTDVGAVLGAGVTGALSVLGGLVFFVGLIVFGIATMRAGVLPRWAGLLLIVGDVVFAAGSFVGPAAPTVFVVGALITCAGLVWLGLTLLSGPSGGVSSRQSARGLGVSSSGDFILRKSPVTSS